MCLLLGDTCLLPCCISPFVLSFTLSSPQGQREGSTREMEGHNLSCCLYLKLLHAHYVQGRRDGSVRDEPYAWQSREFLRKLAVGQVSQNKSTHA